MGFSAIAAGTMAAVGVGTSAYGLATQQGGYDTEKQGLAQEQQGYQLEQQAAVNAAGYSTNIAQYQEQQDAVRRQAMELDASRNTVQAVRQGQAARAMNIASATAQGAGFNAGGSSGSALQGGLAQVRGQTSFNTTGISQNLQMGEQMFNLNANIDQQEINLAQNQTLAAQGQGQVAYGSGIFQQGQGVVSQGAGYMSLGGSLVNAAGTFSNIVGNFGGTGSSLSGVNQGLVGGGYLGGTSGTTVYPGPGRY